MEDGVFPHSRALDEGAAEEERRLCYVGLTRAMRDVTLTYARRRNAFGGRADLIANAVQTLVTQALEDSSLVKDDVIGTIEEMIARIDEKMSAQMNEILHAPEFHIPSELYRGGVA